MPVQENPKSNVLIVNPTGGTPYHGPNLRSYHLAKNLNKIGYNTSVICNAFFHKFRDLPNVEGLITYEEIDGVDYYWLNTKPYNNRGVKQVLNQFEFVYKLFRNYKSIDIRDPDFVISSSPPPFAFFSSKKIADYYDAKLIFEIRDLWPLVIQQLGNFSSFHPYIALLKFTERYAYKNADHVVSVKPGDIQYLQEEYDFNRSDFTYIPNGYDLKNNEKEQQKTDEYREKIPEHKFIIGYLGSLSVAYGIEYLVRAAKKVQANKDIHFIIVGDGPDEKRLKEICRQEDINNVTFLGRIPNPVVPSVLSTFDACYLGYKKAGWLKYGISSNKMFDYMSQAKPILAAVETEYNPVAKANCGIVVPPEDDVEIAGAIEKMYSTDPQKLDEMGQNGKKYLISHHSYAKIARQYSQVFEKV